MCSSGDVMRSAHTKISRVNTLFGGPTRGAFKNSCGSEGRYGVVDGNELRSGLDVDSCGCCSCSCSCSGSCVS